jgi:hypothetical protein
MRKLIVTALMAVIAVLSVSSVASADVARCQTLVDDPSKPVPTQFSVYHPREDFGQWAKTWQHTFNVSIVPATGEFSGEGYEFNGQEPFSPATSAHETIRGTYNATDKTISFEIRQDDGYLFRITNLKANTDPEHIADTGEVQNALTDPVSPYGIVETKVTEPQFTVATTDTAYANHGEYVSAMGGGKVPAQKCVGMPLNSKQGNK